MRPGRAALYRAGLSTGLLGVVFGLAACAGDEPTTEPQPTGLSIAPPAEAAPTSSAPTSAAPASSVPTPVPRASRSQRPTTLLDAVTIAEGAVADSTVVEVSKDDDGAVVWEVTVRAGENGRELRISGADGSVLANESEELQASQLGDEPSVSVGDAVEIAEEQVDDGVATEAELSREDGRRLWDVSVEVTGGAEWELWIDASSGKVIRTERD